MNGEGTAVVSDVRKRRLVAFSAETTPEQARVLSETTEKRRKEPPGGYLLATFRPKNWVE